jgi:hypothetical protein
LTNELLVKKHTVSDAQATFHVKEGKQACLIFQVFLFIIGWLEQPISEYIENCLRYRADSTQCVGSLKLLTVLRFWLCPGIHIKEHSGTLLTLIAKTGIPQPAL